MASPNRFFPPLPNGYSFGNYRIEYLQSQNEMGASYVAWDTERTAWAFIKENLPQVSALREADGVQVKARSGMEDHYLRHVSDFYQEASIMSKLDHPGVAKVLKFFRAGGTAYYALPCDGEMTLGQWFEKNGRPERDQLFSWLRAMVGALGYLHSQELGPWDITPDSFMIKPDGSPVLVEFGVLRRLIGGNVDLAKSSPGYAGIELVKGENVGPWTDFYALGATFYKLLTGEPLPDCKARGKGDMLIPLRNRPELLKLYGPSLLLGIDTAMAFEPSKRWQSASEWLEELDAIPGKEEPLFRVEEHAPAAPAVEKPVEVERKPAPAAPAAVEPAPAKTAAKPAPAPVAQSVPAPEDDQPLFADLIYKSPEGKRVPIGNVLAITCGMLVAASACAYVVFTDNPFGFLAGEGVKIPRYEAPATPAAPAVEETPAPEAPAMPEPEPQPTPEPEPQPVPEPAPEPPAVQPEPETPVPSAPEPPEPPAPVEPEPAVAEPTPEPPPANATPAAEPASLMEAVKAGDTAAASRFLQQGATPQEIHEALGAAITQGNAPMAALLLDNGADLKADLRYEGRLNALGLAVTLGNVEIVDLLLQHNSPRNSRFDGEMTALMIAARDGNVEIVKLLLQAKAQHIRQNAEGDTALILAVRGGHVECAKLIMAANADVNLANKKGERAIDCARTTPHLSDKDRDYLIRLLRRNGAKG